MGILVPLKRAVGLEKGPYKGRQFGRTFNLGGREQKGGAFMLRRRYVAEPKKQAISQHT